MSKARSLLFGSGSALLAAIVAYLVCGAIVAVAGGSVRGFGFSLPVASAILGRLPASIELLLFSCAIALLAGLALTYVARINRTASRLITAVALVVRNIPFFWIAVIVAMLASTVRGDYFVGWASMDGFSLSDHFVHAILPGCLVAMVALTVILEARSEFRVEEPPTLASTLWFCVRALVERLPEIVAASLLTEIMFVWPGLGRLFWNAIRRGDVLMAASTLLFVAIVSIVARQALRVQAGTGSADV
jgi:peptide/nickel transport system permease protein